MNRKMTLLTVGLTLWVLPALQAQTSKKDTTLTKVVVVENEYHPEVLDAQKINRMPAPESAPAQSRQMDYLTSPAAVNQWTFQAAPSVLSRYQSLREERMYARLAYGTRNNLDVKLAFAGQLGKADYLQAGLFANGFKGKLDLLKETTVDGLTISKWPVSAYRFGGDLYYLHQFSKLSANVGGSALAWSYDYLPITLPMPNNALKQQQNTRYQLFAGFETNPSVQLFNLSLTGGATIFNVLKRTERQEVGHEIDYFLRGNLSKDFATQSRIGIDYDLHFLQSNFFQSDGTPYENTVLLGFVPYYSLSTERLHLRAGIHVDAEFVKQNLLRFSPDVNLSWYFTNNRRNAFFLGANGGTVLNSLNRLQEQSIYGVGASQLNTTFKPYDLSAGLKINPLAGLGLTLSAHYTSYKDRVFAIPSYPDLVASTNIPTMAFVEFMQRDAKVFRAHADIAYDLGTRWHIGVSGNYFKWKNEYDTDLHLFLTPQWNFSIDTRLKLVQGFQLTASYQYERRLSIRDWAETPALNRLNVGVEYNALRYATVFIQGNNLLNSRYFNLDAYPDQRAYVMGGLSLKF